MTLNVSHSDGEFARSRAHAEAEAAIMRDRAVRTVTEQAVDSEDLLSLLAMLGLEQAHAPAPARTPVRSTHSPRNANGNRDPWGLA